MALDDVAPGTVILSPFANAGVVMPPCDKSAANMQRKMAAGQEGSWDQTTHVGIELRVAVFFDGRRLGDLVGAQPGESQTNGSTLTIGSSTITDSAHLAALQISERFP